MEQINEVQKLAAQVTQLALKVERLDSRESAAKNNPLEQPQQTKPSLNAQFEQPSQAPVPLNMQRSNFRVEPVTTPRPVPAAGSPARGFTEEVVVVKDGEFKKGMFLLQGSLEDI